jgi:hypothetical protein
MALTLGVEPRGARRPVGASCRIASLYAAVARHSRGRKYEVCCYRSITAVDDGRWKCASKP